jgi:hypothetical protein
MTTALSYAIKFVSCARRRSLLRRTNRCWRGGRGPATDPHGHRIAKLRDSDGAEFSIGGS